MNNNTKIIEEFIELFKNTPQKAYDFINHNAYRFSKDEITNILKEVLYNIKNHMENLTTMKVNLFYGKVNKNGIGDVDILFAKDVNLEDVTQQIKEYKQEMLNGWSSTKEGDLIRVVAINNENDYYEIVDEFSVKE